MIMYILLAACLVFALASFIFRKKSDKLSAALNIITSLLIVAAGVAFYVLSSQHNAFIDGLASRFG